MSTRRFPSAPEADAFVSGPLSGPHLFTPGEVREFRRLAMEHAGADLSEAEAEDLANRFLRALTIVRDVQVKVAEPPVPAHDLRELTLHLRKLQHELELTAGHPSCWRWALMSLFDAMRLTLTPAGSRDAQWNLLKHFGQAVNEHPELPQVRSSIELLDRLRTKCVTVGVLRWPVGKDRLRSICSDCLRVIQRLEPETGTDVRNIEDVLQELA